MHERFQPNQNRKPSSHLPVIAAILVAVVVIVGGFLSWRWYNNRSKLAGQQDYQAPNVQTDTGNESKRDDSATNTDTQNKELESTSPSPNAVNSNALPMPLLTKSSGNNGSVPPGAVIEFVCTSPSGFQCKIELKGPEAITLETKSVVGNGRGQAAATWTWPAKAGSWSITAILSDNNKNQKASLAQKLEVK